MPSSNDGTEGAYLPQEKKVEVSPLQQGQDAGAEKDVQALTVSETLAASTSRGDPEQRDCECGITTSWSCFRGDENVSSGMIAGGCT
jgi:hypothetical protein